MRCRRCGRRVAAAGKLCPACAAQLRPSRRWLVQIALALLLGGGLYYLAVYVVQPQEVRLRAERLWRQSMAALLPPPTQTYAPLPSATPDSRPTPSRIPTATPSHSPTPTPTAIETATVALSASPQPTVTSVVEQTHEGSDAPEVETRTPAG
jgi:hypothetical protein